MRVLFQFYARTLKIECKPKIVFGIFVTIQDSLSDNADIVRKAEPRDSWLHFFVYMDPNNLEATMP